MDGIFVRDVASKTVVTLTSEDTLDRTRNWLQSGAEGTTHQGFPVVDARGWLVGVLTRRDLLAPEANGAARLGDLLRRSPKFVYDDCTVRQAADHMLNHGIGRLPVVRRARPAK